MSTVSALQQNAELADAQKLVPDGSFLMCAGMMMRVQLFLWKREWAQGPVAQAAQRM